MNEKEECHRLSEFQNQLQKKVLNLLSMYMNLYDTLDCNLSSSLYKPDGLEMETPLQMLGIHRNCKDKLKATCTCLKQIHPTYHCGRRQRTDEEYSLIKPNVVFFGQSNAGKSSLINELLGKSTLSQFEEKCTARLIYLQYCVTPCWALETSPESGEFIVNDLNPESWVIPDYEQGKSTTETVRSDHQFVRRSIVAGLPSSILQCCTLIDTPGMRENSTLQAECQEIFLDCVKPLLAIYVLDASDSVTDMCIRNCELIIKKIKQTQNRDIQLIFFATRLDLDSLVLRKKELNFQKRGNKMREEELKKFYLKLIDDSIESKLSDIFYKLSWADLIPRRENFDACEYTFGSSLSVLMDCKNKFPEEKIEPCVKYVDKRIVFHDEKTIHLNRMSRFKSSILYHIQKQMTEGFMRLAKLWLSKLKKLKKNHDMRGCEVKICEFIMRVEKLRECIRSYPNPEDFVTNSAESFSS